MYHRSYMFVLPVSSLVKLREPKHNNFGTIAWCGGSFILVRRDPLSTGKKQIRKQERPCNQKNSKKSPANDKHHQHTDSKPEQRIAPYPFHVPTKKAYITNNICFPVCLFSFVYSESLFSVSSMTASVSLVPLPAVNLFTISGTMSKIFVTPS